MNKRIKNRLINLSNKLFNVADGKNKHFSFIFDKNKLISFGYNQAYKTHPEAKSAGYRFCAIHSELSAILRYKNRNKDFTNFTLVNVRLNSEKALDMSKPCKLCQKLINSLNFKKIYYSDYDGNFIRYK